MMSEYRTGADASPEESCPDLIGESMVMRSLRRSIQRVAPVNAPVLITGETGTGKELVAQLLHRQSGVAGGPFVAVNCAALPQGLFQAEVFGYEKGAFTGAYRRHAGRIEAAAGGTLLLDEIGDIALDMQVVLLRFLEEGLFERLGGSCPIQADVRIIAATSADLETACRNGQFREDLYYRLNALRIKTPPLRERGDDIESLARHFLAQLCAELQMRPHEFASDALTAMRQYHWPGNVRELRNRVRQALVMSEGETLFATDLELAPAVILGAEADVPAGPTLRQCREAAERQALEQALIATGGDISAAAKRLKISRAQLYRLLKRYRLNPAAANRRRTDRARVKGDAERAERPDLPSSDEATSG